MDLLNALKANLTAALRSFGHTRHTHRTGRFQTTLTHRNRGFSHLLSSDVLRPDPSRFLSLSLSLSAQARRRWPPEAWPRLSLPGEREKWRRHRNGSTQISKRISFDALHCCCVIAVNLVTI